MLLIAYALGVLTLVMVSQTLVIWRLSKRIGAAEHGDRRLSQFAEALRLLTDTTETGLTGVATELEGLGRRRRSPAADGSASARPARPRAAGRRIVAAIRRGKPVVEIAAGEGMSESEVLLYLGMSADADAKGSDDGAVRL
jgi:hypothetical protein